MAEENKKGGFWASLFGRNKKQDEPKIEPIIEEEKITDIVPSIEKLETHDLVEEPSELESVESAVDSEPFLAESTETNEIVEEEKIQEISTALGPVEEIIEAKNLEDDLPITETVVESEIVEDIKDELQPVVEIETSEKPSEGGFFSRLVKGLLKTKQNIGAGFRSFFLGKKIDDELFEELEEQLLIADIGVPTTSKIIKNLTEHASRKELQDAELLYQQLKVEMADILEPVAQPLEIDNTKKPYVILMVGVNGVGKTTTIGKLARKFQAEGKSVMLAAGDTFRAAAIEQLDIWAERIGIPIIKQRMNADPASVAFDTLSSAVSSSADVVIIDTAGRLHNKIGLMNELSKIKRVMQKVVPSAPHEVLLVLDGSTGQNAFEQAKQFTAATEVNALAITKLDGTAKGGVVIGISDQFKVPVKYIGLGEGIDDLQLFRKKEFVDSLFGE